VALAYAEEEFKYNLPKGLLVAIGYRESSQRPNVVSKAKAYGLIQVQVPTGFDAAKRLGQISSKAKPSDWKKHRTKLVAMLKDPRCNIELGSNTLSNYLRRSNGNLEKALAKYSNGAKDYSGKIIGRMRAIQAHIMK
jgi:soluble lytic murein transglycosylase-like protein